MIIKKTWYISLGFTIGVMATWVTLIYATPYATIVNVFNHNSEIELMITQKLTSNFKP